MRTTRLLGLALTLGACDCRSDAEVANSVLGAASIDPSSPHGPAVDHWDVRPGASNTDPCPDSPGQLVVAIAGGLLADLQVHEGTTYWAGSSVFSSDGSGATAELMTPEREPRWLCASALGLFAITQTRSAPARTRLLFRDNDGVEHRAIERDDVLLSDMVPAVDGAYLLAGRVRGSVGSRSQLLHYSVADARARVVLDLERGALFLAHDDTQLYWVAYPQTGADQTGSSAIVSYPIAGGELSVLTEMSGSLSSLAVGPEHVYFVHRADLVESQGRLLRVPKAGGEVELVHPAVRAHSVFVHGGAIYAQTRDPRDADASRRRIDSIHLESHEVTNVVEDPHLLAQPRLVDGVLYWLTQPGPGLAHDARCLRSAVLPGR